MTIYTNCVKILNEIKRKGFFKMDYVLFAELLEITMVVSFGCSWPFNVIRSYKARTTKGKSLTFLLLVLFGYVAGILSKFINPNFDFATKWYVVFFYILNFIMVGIDTLLYFRNKLLDKKRAECGE